MAQTTYTSIQPVTLQTRTLAYELAANLLMHLNNFGLNLISLDRDGTNHIVVTIDNPIPASHSPSLWGLQ